MQQLDVTTACEALFVSELQSSQDPEPREVRETIARIVRTLDSASCAALMAQEFGDHPETAVERMRWARRTVTQRTGEPIDH